MGIFPGEHRREQSLVEAWAPLLIAHHHQSALGTSKGGRRDERNLVKVLPMATNKKATYVGDRPDGPSQGMGVTDFEGDHPRGQSRGAT